MGKRMNGLIVLLTAVLDLLLGLGWYVVLWPPKPKEITMTISAVLGASIMFLTFIVVFVNYMVYDEVIKDD